MVAELETAISQRGLLLVHDRELPSATRVLAGEPIAGPWQDHPAAGDIYGALRGLGEDVRRMTLIRGKVTLVHRRLWPSVLGVAIGGERWQTADLSSDARFLLRRLRQEGDVMSEDIRLPEGSREQGVVIADLEKRLLLRRLQAPTEGGKPVKFLRSWEVTWQDVKPLPALDGRLKLEAITANWGSQPLFPWS